MTAIKFKQLHPKSQSPKYDGTSFLLHATEISQGPVFVCKFGVSVEIPEGYVGAILPRPSISLVGWHVCAALVRPGESAELSCVLVRLANYAPTPSGCVAELVVYPVARLEVE